MLTQLQDPALQSILGQNVNTPPPTLKPEEAELYQVFPPGQLSIDRNMSPAIMKPSTFVIISFYFQSQIAAATALAQNGDLAPPLHLPPPNFNQVTSVMSTNIPTFLILL